MTRRGRRRTRPTVETLSVEAPNAGTAESEATGAATRPDELPTVPSTSEQHPRPEHAKTPGPDDASELALLRAAVREAKMRRVKARALRDHPELSPFADLIEADTPDEYEAVAADLAARLGGGNDAGTSDQTTGPPVGASCPAIEAPDEADLGTAVAAGNYAAIARDPVLRAEYRRRYL
jgi:hypothetical protein